MKNIVFVIIVLAILGAGYYWFGLTKEKPAPVEQSSGLENVMSGEEHIVTLTADGFVPDDITIAQGDTVTWKTTADRLFWPASNLHPSHRDYPGGIFDPKEPIQPNVTWSFTFNLTGDWKYHDHLAPYNTGVVHVE